MKQTRQADHHTATTCKPKPDSGGHEGTRAPQSWNGRNGSTRHTQGTDDQEPERGKSPNGLGPNDRTEQGHSPTQRTTHRQIAIYDRMHRDQETKRPRIAASWEHRNWKAGLLSDVRWTIRRWGRTQSDLDNQIQMVGRHTPTIPGRTCNGYECPGRDAGGTAVRMALGSKAKHLGTNWGEQK